MKNLITYLSKKSLSLENGSGMTRKRLGIDSGMTRFSLVSLICLCMLTIGSGNVWGAENDTHDFAQSISKLLNNCNVPDDIEISDPGYPVKEVIITYSYNKSTPATANVTIDGNAWGSGFSMISSKTSASISDDAASGDIVISFTANASCSGTKKGTLGITNVRLVEGAGAAPAYTITATRNNDSYGTVSVTGTTITASPSTCYQVASGAGGYTVTSGTATVSHTGTSNTLTVTPSSNCTVQVNFEKQTVNTYVDEIQGNSDIEDCGTHDAPSLDDEDPASSGTCAQQHWHFMGWVTSANKANPTDANIITPGTEMTANGTTYYAVWAKGTGGGGFDGENGGTFKIYADVSGTKYYATSTISSGKFGRTTDANSAAEFTIAPVDGGFTIKLGDNYVYYTGSTNLGTQNSSYTWTFASGVKGTWRANSATSGRGFIYRDGTGFGGYSTSNVTAGGTEYYDLEIGGGYEYSDYICTCCTPLGSVTGNIGTNTPTSVTLTWSAVSGAEKYQVKVPGSSSHNDWTDAVSGVSVTKSCGTAYTAYFRAIDTNGSHCSTGPESTTAVPAVSWTVTSTGVTNATASPAIPSTTCSGFSTTISAATGYALPAEITVTNASKTWNSSTGALTISSVTGNVSITITPTCVPPVITADPADADYYVGDDPTALSVTATLASGTLTYLWKVSTNGGSTWSDAEGTNNLATYNGASLSTASAGTIKFKCIVGNSQGGCTVESGVATITVNAASSWKLKGSWDSWEEHTMIEDAGVASYSISLDADSRFEFGFDGGSFYKNNGTIITTTSGWVFNTTDNNCHIHTGPAGTYTFAINTSTKAVTVTYPTVSHPNEHYVYFKNTNVWGTVYGYLANSGNDNKAAAWPGSVMQPTTTICGETYHYAALNAMSGTYNTIIFNNGNSGYGNQTSDLSTTGSLGKYNANQDANWHQFKYTISFNGNGNTDGSMSSITELCPGSNQALTSNAFTKDHYTFAGWHADVAVKVGESTIPVGSTISDGVTIKDIQSDINLTAQWTPNTYTITKTLTNVANAGLPASFTYTGSTTTALNSTFTVDATNFFLPSSIAVTMGGTPLTAGTDYTYNNSTGAFTFSAVITGNIVITATATAKLKSIAITTQPTTRKYFAGETFSSTGAVVTATMGDGSTKAVSATWTPSGALSAGTGQTVTATYTEAGIEKTATTTIDVYSVTVNKKNEDGDAIDVAGVTATWTVGSKALAAGVGSTKYVFKEWQVTGASIGSTSSANTTLSSPTANVVVNAVFYKPRVIKWSVNGDDSYETGSPTTTVAYNGTISAVPTAPADNTLSCTNKFMGWSTKDAGTTPKTTSYYDDLFTNASGYTTNITAATTTFYAVFAEASSSRDEGYYIHRAGAALTVGKTYVFGAVKAAASTTLADNTVFGAVAFTNTYNSTTPNWGPYVDLTPSSSGYIAADDASLTNACKWTLISISSGNHTFKNGDNYLYLGSLVGSTTNGAQSGVSTSSGNCYISNVHATCKDAFMFYDKSDPTSSDKIMVYNTSNGYRMYEISAREDKHSATMTPYVRFYEYDQGYSYNDYVTQCDANIVKVTYDANGGVTSCTNTTTDKTEDYTVCSTPPTRDYYTFAGWLCSADSKTYAANATISAAAIDADFTLTAQWTPVTYTITYELDGGTNSGSNPATYNVETATITLQDPTKGHDRFDGWYDNGSFTGDAITSIPLGSHGNITLYAKWATRHEIIFDADGTKTTIYRADDEDLSASVAGQGSVPSDPDAPSSCSSKVFVGWSESTIDGETNTRPGDLMKPAAGTVNANKHYYAVWATASGSSGTLTYGWEDADATTGWTNIKAGTSSLGTYVSAHGGSKAANAAASAADIQTEVVMIQTVNKIQITALSFYATKEANNTAAASWILQQSDDGSSWEDIDFWNASSVTRGTWTKYELAAAKIDEITSGAYIRIILSTASTSKRDIDDISISYDGTSYSAYSTSCCPTKIVLSDPSITDASSSGSTITFDKSSPVYTCGGTKTVTATLTLTAGYQASALSFAVNSGTVSISPAISTPVTSSQVYTLTFAEDQNATLTTTATIAAKPLNGITISPSSGEVYVGQYVDFTVSYDPADYINPGYTLNATPVYVTKESAAPANTKLRLKGGRGSGPGASITETVNETVTIKASGDNTKMASVEMTVKPLPRVHFVDLVHGKAFADVVATIAENALNPNKTTKTSVDWVTPNANSCEENHLHLVGWIREDWPALVNYLNGTGDAPTTTAIVGAGNDGSGNAYYIAAGASINVQTFDGVTFYAVWSKVE